MKTCFKCHATKPLDAFYKHPMMADGHLNKCKECAKRDVSDRYSRLIATPEGLEAERSRGREKYHRLYAGPEERAKTNARHPKTGRNWTSPTATAQQKQRAHNALIRAVASGKVNRPKRCEDCGNTNKRIHGHHEDYLRPLAVNWVCTTCHRRRHATNPDRVKK